MIAHARAVLIWSLLIAAGLCGASGLASAQRPTTGPSTLPPSERILVVYLSRTNNTRAVAEFIRERTGGTLVALELVTPYPSDYRAHVRQVVRENETGYLPPLATTIDRLDRYDVIFIGFPTWGMQLPPPIKSFLRQYDLQGKTVVPFNTNAGYGVGSSFETVKALCPRSRVLEGYTTRGGVERDGVNLAITGARAQAVKQDVEAWLQSLDLPVVPRR
ncbi:flavodoxin [Luteitalea sp.]|uniref:flavodoxin n=1 Tax=Luteitalea sp. TaxID=2004800 RepID=UPI0025BAF7B5|nr:flavodoxin [Luteitalea sp.]